MHYFFNASFPVPPAKHVFKLGELQDWSMCVSGAPERLATQHWQKSLLAAYVLLGSRTISLMHEQNIANESSFLGAEGPKGTKWLKQ